jgi:glycosyltransferase involved in cell wall biosynthesis
VADRLRLYNAVEGTPLYHPPPGAARLRAGSFSDYVLWVGRLEANKRPGLLLDALALTKSKLLAVFAGRGPQEDALRQSARARGLEGRVELRGLVSDEEKIALYAGARAVVYPPFHEDLGYVTLEAFLAGKPVITTEDAGGPTEFVRTGVNGFVARDAAGIAAAIDAYAKDPDLAERQGVAGRATYAETIPTWESVCARLLERT